MCLFSSLQILSIGLCWSIGSSFRSMETAIWCEYDLEKILQDLLIEIGWEIWWMRWLIIFKFHVDSVWNLHTIEGASWLLFSTFSNRLIDMLLSNYFCIYLSSPCVYYYWLRMGIHKHLQPCQLLSHILSCFREAFICARICFCVYWSGWDGTCQWSKQTLGLCTLVYASSHSSNLK